LYTDEESRLVTVRKDIDTVDTKVNVAAGNGLFQNQTAVTANTIQDILRRARTAADENNLTEAETQMSLANTEFYAALNQTKRNWRFLNVYAIHVWMYLASFLVGIFLFYYYDLATILSNNDNFQLIAIYAATWGCIGSILRGFWYLRDKVDLRKYSNSWIIYFLSTPFIGGILGVIVYLLIVGGLVSISQNQFNIDHVLVILPFSALAGFNWWWAIDLFIKIGGIFSTSKKEKTN